MFGSITGEARGFTELICLGDGSALRDIEHKLDTYDVPPARWMLVQISFVDVYKQTHLPQSLLEE